jgi:hypothetical protein
MLMRSDLELFQRSGQRMLNWEPTLQGSMQRSPGSRFLYDARTTADAKPATVRIFPYITPDNIHALVEMQPKEGATLGNIKLVRSINTSANSISQDDALNPSTVYKGTVNGAALNNFDDWEYAAPPWTDGDGYSYGWTDRGGGFQVTGLLQADGGNSQGVTSYIRGTFDFEEAADHIIVTPDFRYVDNFAGITTGGADIRIFIGTAPGLSDIANIDLSFLNPGSARYNNTHRVNFSFLTGTTYHISFQFTAVEVPGQTIDKDRLSTPYFVLYTMDALALVTSTPDLDSLTAVVPYFANELRDVQFIQSPYPASTENPAGKELVFTHPNYPPKRLYFDGANYVFNDIPFTPPEALTNFGWATKGYPAACSSYMGRLVLAGSVSDGAVINDPTGNSTETVWCTDVGDWNTFTSEDPAVEEVLPEHSVVFTTIYRSPIHWVQGHKQLLVGAESMEYTASADGIFQPTDLGVFMQSTHGSNRVQPIPMGEYVLYPADGGTKVRSMKYVADDEGWISPDMNIQLPEPFEAGIRRMVRMRNPHQMAVVLNKNGKVWLLHLDTHENIRAWSEVQFGGTVVDITVLVDENGFDILYAVISRQRTDGAHLHIEAVPNWVDDGRPWVYMQAYITTVNTAGTNTITGLDHLEGQFVHVVADGDFLGSYLVASGTVTLTDDLGNPIIYTTASAGRVTNSRFVTNPVVGRDPGSRKRYTDIGVRCIDSSPPIINGQRAFQREAVKPLDTATGRGELFDTTYAGQAAEVGEPITVEENLPVKVEVVGIFGKITENSL